MISSCQDHQNIDVLVPRIADKSTQGANILPKGHPVCVCDIAQCDIATYQYVTVLPQVIEISSLLRARGPPASYPRFSPFAGAPQNRRFFYQNTDMSLYQDTTLFTIL